MSLEAALAKLTEEVAKNTAALAAIGKAAGAKTAGTTAPKDTKPKDEKKKAITDDQLREAFGGYLTSGDADKKAERKANLNLITTHYGAENVVSIPAEKREAALADLKAFKDGEKPDWAASDEPADDDDDMLG